MERQETQNRQYNTKEEHSWRIDITGLQNIL